MRIIYLLLFFMPISLLAQVSGGRTAFQTLRLSPSARVLGMGGIQLAIVDDDINMAAANPAALSMLHHGRLSYQQLFYYAGVKGGQFAYAHQRKKQTFAVGLQYMDYGDFIRADEYGTANGNFVVADYSAWAASSYQLYDKLRLGVKIRGAHSKIDSHLATALMADFAATWQDTARRVVATFAIINAGAVLETYDPAGTDKLPFEIQAGISKRLAHLPLRFSIHAQHLQRWNLRYSDPDADDGSNVFGQTEPTESQFKVSTDNLFRHLVFGTEFLLGPRELFRIRLGYNHLRRRELSVDQYRSLAGFSGGMGFKLSKFRLDYGIAFYHIAGPVHSIGISSALSEFVKPKS